MIVKSKLNGKLRRPKNAAQRKALASRDFFRRQQLSVIGVGGNASGFLDESGRISGSSVINKNSEIWSGM